MSSVPSSVFSRSAWLSRLLAPRHCTSSLAARNFSSSSVLFLRKIKKPPAPSKKELEQKAKLIAQRKRDRWLKNPERMTLSEAVDILRAVEVARPSATYELTIRTEMKRAMAVPRGRISLPREIRRKGEDKVVVFAEGKAADDAKDAGADIVGGLELVDSVANGRIRPTIVLATPALIRTITPKLGRVLGPRGIMPSERRGTVLEDVATYIRKLKGSNEWRGDVDGVIRSPIAKMNFPPEDVIRNVRHFLNTVKKHTGQEEKKAELQVKKSSKKSASKKPSPSIIRVVLSSTMGPSIQISDY